MNVNAQPFVPNQQSFVPGQFSDAEESDSSSSHGKIYDENDADAYSSDSSDISISSSSSDASSIHSNHSNHSDSSSEMALNYYPTWNEQKGDFSKQYKKLKKILAQPQTSYGQVNHRERKDAAKSNSTGKDGDSEIAEDSVEKKPKTLKEKKSLPAVQKASRKAVGETKTQKDKETRATVEQVLDKKTRMILFKMLNNGVITEINGCISTGKEANVYHATKTVADESGELSTTHYAIKVYKTSILIFKDRNIYLQGDHRFKQGYSKNTKKMIALWAEKEFRNLRRLALHSIPSPIVYKVSQNVLLMQLLGKKDRPAKKLKDVRDADWKGLYVELCKTVWVLFQRCKLVHADLSDYNILYHNRHLYIIDVSQSVEHDHPHALEFLRKDCTNILDFFKKRIHTLSRTDDTADPDEVPDLEDEEAQQEETNQTESSQEPVAKVVVNVLTLRELFDFIVSDRDSLISLCAELIDAIIVDGDDESGVNVEDEVITMSTGRVAGYRARLDDVKEYRKRRDERVTKEEEQDMDNSLLDLYLELKHYKISSRSLKFYELEKINEKVFLNSFIPRTLDDVLDFERDGETLKKGGGDNLLYSSVTGLAHSAKQSNPKDSKSSAPELTPIPKIVKPTLIESTQALESISPVPTNFESEDFRADNEKDDSDASGSDDDGNSGSDEESEGEGEESRHGNKKFLKKNEDKESKRDRKKAVKESKREKRKEKVPKSVKKRKQKVASEKKK
ncbi:Serine/threonine-protein kinase RIO1 [Nowakowskiella sp. JEL0407]|nr:Serine/threonine-protein kinase RIO1 [Nowakowskiella sp. JEL0407]